MKCVQCSAEFAVTANDRDIYNQLDLPPPTHCPACRVTRRMCWRNDLTFYVRKSDFSGKQMISIYPPQAPFPVYHPSEWYGDGWDAMRYGRDYDFKKAFFAQWRELMLAVPR